MNRKSLSLFGVVVFGTSLFLAAGWIIGSLFGGLYGSIGAGIGGVVGAMLASEFAHWKGLFEAEWDRLVGLGGCLSFALFGGLASGMEAHSIVIALFAILGAGFGALGAKYLLRFFLDEPPLSIK